MTRFISPILLLLSFLFTYQSTNAQASCDDLKKENEYLKNALKISTPTKTITSSKIDFNLLKVEGAAKEQTASVILTLVNHDVNRDFHFSKAVAIDMEGNEYEFLDIKIGSASIINKIYTDTPIKTVVKFSKVLPAVKIFKLVSVAYYTGETLKTIDLEFKDLAISWK
ncbi:hypothetical protein SAMN05428949_4169 [Chitinophaga sp. YR627]|uniref:hypothetical protein n=1 Tax=Chitinophaga sp. YR627 TaxID=1881041 RepID=UPI0008E34C29|nr:hypothetical protein [Chitinophaga sp. YR627]SFO02475.1 hypothetical protein SAMN05428949_4169 [Chitinophaga sp. YR627]